MIERQVTPAYTAAREAAAVADMSDWGWLRISGRNRLDFFQRLSTNDFRRLPAGQGRPTVLTSPTGRVIAFVLVYAGQDAAFVRTEPGQAAPVARYLNNLIFWNDDIQVADLSTDTAHWGIYGPRARASLERVAEPEALADLEPYAWQVAWLAGVPAAVHRGGPLELPAWTVVAPRSEAGRLGAALASLGPAVDAATLQQLRVEAGLPAWGHELSDQVTPLEAGLLAAISFDKGCYTGQEVIARQMNYDKITRRLAGLRLPSGAGPELVGASIRGTSGRPGFITSVAYSPALGEPVALAIVPRDAEPGSEVTIKQGERELAGTVAELPLVNVRS